MSKKLFVMCFPDEFLDFMPGHGAWTLGQLFTDVLEERYLDKGHGFLMVKGACGDRVFDDDRLFQLRLNKFDHMEIPAQVDFHYNGRGEYADFAAVTKQIEPQKYSKIRVGGFQATDCVHKLARRIFNENSNTLVDTELTNYFALHFFDNWNNFGRPIERNTEFVSDEYDPKRAYSRLEQVQRDCYLPTMRKLFNLPHFGGVETQGRNK